MTAQTITYPARSDKPLHPLQPAQRVKHAFHPSNQPLAQVNNAQKAIELIVSTYNNTTLKGANANADTINADIKGNLSIESLQDTSTYDSKQTSAGAGVSLCIPPICYGSVVAVNANAAKTKINGEHTSVGTQSGLKAGDGGFNVKVGGKTELVGGAITSTDKAQTEGKNQFTSAGGVTIQDLENKSALDASSVSVSLNTGSGSTGGMAGYGSVKDKQDSTTKAGITGVAGNTAARTGDAETGLKPVFSQQDADKVTQSLAVQTAVTAEFGKNSAKLVGDVAGKQQKELTDQAAKAKASGNSQEAERLSAEADKWSEGGAYRVAMHVVAGAMGGGVNGAAGAAASASAAGVMDKVQAQMQDSLIAGGMNPAVAKATASLLTLGAAATLSGAAGGVQGATTGMNVDANNRQLHPTEAQLIRANAARYAKDRGISREQAELELTQQALRQVDSAWSERVPDNAKAAAYLQQLTQNNGSVDVGGGKLFDARGTTAFTNHTINAIALPQTVDLYNRLNSTNTRGITPNVRGSFVALNDAAHDRNVGTANSPSIPQLLQTNRTLAGQAQTSAEQLSTQSANLGIVQSGFTQGGIKPGTPKADPLVGALGEAALAGLPSEGGAVTTPTRGMGARANVDAPDAPTSSGARVPNDVLELGGGPQGSKVPNARNIDPRDPAAVGRDMTNMPEVPSNSQRVVVVNNPFLDDVKGANRNMMSYLPETARVTQPGGEIVISGNTSNPFFNRVPTKAELDALGLEIKYQGAMPAHMQGQGFAQTTGTTISSASMRTIIFVKKLN